MDKRQLAQQNFDFIQGVLQTLDERGAQMTIAIAFNERNEAIVISHPSIDKTKLYQTLREIANQVGKQAGGIIHLY